jgi:hypothetical protein
VFAQPDVVAGYRAKQHPHERARAGDGRRNVVYLWFLDSEICRN